MPRPPNQTRITRKEVALPQELLETLETERRFRGKSSVQQVILDLLWAWSAARSGNPTLLQSWLGDGGVALPQAAPQQAAPQQTAPPGAEASPDERDACADAALDVWS